VGYQDALGFEFLNSKPFHHDELKKFESFILLLISFHWAHFYFSAIVLTSKGPLFFSSPQLSASMPPIGRRYSPTKPILFQGCRGCPCLFAQAFEVQVFARKNFCMKAYYI
ncbi:MAG: hypothetical protein VSS75_014700, partial [Candidatus Parabeggiatoa sp.]|nr:hypothetical protein [Candidatus Parabeggiatoa sp.]